MKNNKAKVVEQCPVDFDWSAFDSGWNGSNLKNNTNVIVPKTASKVLDLTEKIVKENNLTTLMITHNMKDAIKYGNRLIMLSEGNLILDISGEEKANLTIEDLLQKFENSGTTVSDKMLF